MLVEGNAGSPNRWPRAVTHHQTPYPSTRLDLRWPKLVLGRAGGQHDPATAQRGIAGRARATKREVRGGHAIYIADPGAVATLIRGARSGERNQSTASPINSTPTKIIKQ